MQCQLCWIRCPNMHYRSLMKVIVTNKLAAVRAVFKWLSNVITWLRLLRLVIGLKDSRQFFNQWESKQKPIAPCTRDCSRASSKLQVIVKNSDWFITLPAPVVICRSNCSGFGFSTLTWKPLYYSNQRFWYRIEATGSFSNVLTH